MPAIVELSKEILLGGTYGRPHNLTNCSQDDLKQ